jgi:hypothetical protein
VPIFANPLNNTLSGYASNDPAPISGTSVISQQMADDFFFASNETIKSITWYGNYVNDAFGAGHLTDFEIRIFADVGNGSSPVNAAPLFSGDVRAVARSTGPQESQASTITAFFLMRQSGIPLSLAQGTYWLSIVESDPLTMNEVGIWEWASTETGSGAINVRRL